MKRTSSVVLAALLLSQTGCWPGVAWLPDSSGFYYTGGKGNEKLLFFDVAKKESRVVVADTKGNTVWPAVKPDGNEIAIARLEPGDETVTLRLAFYSPDGKGPRVSAPWTVQLPKKDALMGVQMYWSPGGDKILVSYYRWAAIYDLRRDTFLPLGTVTPAHYGGSPLIPDGSGFLVVKLVAKRGDEVEHFDFAKVDWKGVETVLATEKDVGTSKVVADLKVPLYPLQWPGLFQSRWDRNVAVVDAWGVEFRLDPAKQSLTVIDRAGNKPAEQREYSNNFSFAKTKTRVEATKVQEGGQPAKRQPDLQLSVKLPGRREGKVLLAANRMAFLPSRDQDTLVVSVIEELDDNFTRGLFADHLLVINNQGEVIADLRPRQ